ncbi:glycosyltransferase family 25 protein [Ruegeria faecimaris]|uniref:glycosyltransferase family 25 protein n=1 Tax=Ruegeria faecimaris TaxID=686389 RepID=UPI00248F8148|nr:glycosyltransferase family 25 protein [Ruegeria faecimaris]
MNWFGAVQISEVIVVSLKDDTDRRAHVACHFADRGIEGWRFLDAIPAEDDAVKNVYREGHVAPFPPCFRCGRETSCTCANNVLIPSQVANWLSFKALWHEAAKANGLILACEDDVWFAPEAMPRLDELLTRLGAGVMRTPFLLRLGQSGIDPESITHEVLKPLSTTQKVQMSNVAHVMNREMALLLLAEFQRIATTSDTWIHNEMASRPDVTALTADPLLATDLSYNATHAKFLSRIHPKGISEADKERARTHIKRCEDTDDYARRLEQWIA